MPAHPRSAQTTPERDGTPPTLIRGPSRATLVRIVIAARIVELSGVEQ
jgi:hypothetical protein